MSILLGLCTALSWGAVDFFVRNITHRIGALRTQFYMQFLGLVVLGGYLLVSGELQILLNRSSWLAWGQAIGAILLTITATFSLFRAFEVGKLALVSPIASSYAAITVALSLMSGELLTVAQVGAIIVILVSIISISASLRSDTAEEMQVVHRHRIPYLDSFDGVIWALLAAICYGFSFWMLGPVTRELGPVVPVWLSRVLTPCLFLIGAPVLRQTLKPPPMSLWWALLGVSALDTAAFIIYTFSLTLGNIAIATMLSSLYTIVTVLLAGIFLRERLRLIQWVGVGGVFLGIALVNF